MYLTTYLAVLSLLEDSSTFIHWHCKTIETEFTVTTEYSNKIQYNGNSAEIWISSEFPLYCILIETGLPTLTKLQHKITTQDQCVPNHPYTLSKVSKTRLWINNNRRVFKVHVNYLTWNNFKNYRVKCFVVLVVSFSRYFS